MGRVAIDETGNRYKRLLVQGRDQSPARDAKWRCLCECGTVVIIRGVNLRNGSTASCGCLRRETTSATRPTHG